MFRLIAAVMTMLAFAPGALANIEAGSQCFAPAVDTCAAAPTSGDVFLFAHDPACKDQIGYENCMWDSDNRWVTCMRVALTMLSRNRGWEERRCHADAKFSRDSCQWRHCNRRSGPPLPPLSP